MLGVLVVGCLFGPFLLSETGDGDPVHASLLPPLTRVTVLELTDGRTVMSTDVKSENGVWVVGGSKRTSSIQDDEIVSRHGAFLLLGSDRFGRDVLRRLLEGGRISLLVAALGVSVALLVGLGVGLAAATGGRVVDAIVMRTVDALLAFPVLLLLVLLSALFRPGPLLLITVLGLSSWMGLARLVRGQVLSLRSRGFIQAARVAGTRGPRMWILHYLPNLKAPVAQDTALQMGNLVLAEATLSFLGLGIPATLPSWGHMVAEGQRVMLDGWWLSIFPGLAITALVVSLALIGDGIQRSSEASA
jgi:ABC-type dipeptide/oligopeptide/nickel transport system permease subunit